MSLEKLDNLVKIGQLKFEPPDQNEFDGMVASAKARLQDSKLSGLSAPIASFFLPMVQHMFCHSPLG
jgi:hypothetical protein